MWRAALRKGKPLSKATFPPLSARRTGVAATEGRIISVRWLLPAIYA
jgi:hypothetical protein